MAENSKIEWTDHTFNPWWGCVRVSPACLHCYAEAFDKRVGGKNWGVNAPRRFFGDKHWNEPLKWNRDAEAVGVRKRVFCASMADVFESLSFEHSSRNQMDIERVRLFDLISKTPNLDWMLLTKRPENIWTTLHGILVPPREDEVYRRLTKEMPLPNVWFGFTAENQKYFDERWVEMREIADSGSIIFVSIEPQLGEVVLPDDFLSLGRRTLVICGGESGHGARPTDLNWPRALRDQCVAAGVNFHFKQWGEWLPRGQTRSDGAENYVSFGKDPARYRELGNGVITSRVTKKAAGRLLDGRTWDEFPVTAK